MSTPVIEVIDNVNQSSLETVFAAVAADPTARDNLSQSDRNIDAVSTNVGVIEELDASEEAIRKMLCRREGRDPANFADLGDVAADQGLMQSIAGRQESSKILAASQKAMTEIDQVDFAVRAIMCGTTSLDPTSFADADAISQDATAMSEIAGNATTMNTIAASQTAMQEVAASQTAMQEVESSQTARDEVFASQTAMQEVAASQTAMQEVAASQTAMSELTASQTARDEVFASQTAMQEVAASQTAMQEVAASQTAMQEVAASQTAMQEVAASQTAMQEIGLSQTAQTEILNSNTAVTVLNSGSTSFNADFTGSQDTNERVVIPETDENYAVYINQANYTGYDGSPIDNYGWYDTDNTYLGETINEEFIDTLTIGWNKETNTSINRALNGDIDAVIF